MSSSRSGCSEADRLSIYSSALVPGSKGSKAQKSCSVPHRHPKSGGECKEACLRIASFQVTRAGWNDRCDYWLAVCGERVVLWSPYTAVAKITFRKRTPAVAMIRCKRKPESSSTSACLVSISCNPKDYSHPCFL